jgi:primosomal protein N'
MFTIRVIPISKASLGGELTYFSTAEVHTGTLVTVPLRKKNVPGLVVSSDPVFTQKASLKRGSFSLKKVADFHAREIFLPEFLKSAEDLAHHYAAPTGSILRALIPFSLVHKLPERVGTEKASSDRDNLPRYAYEAPLKERLETYTGIIRSTFAKGKSVYIVLPTIEEAHFLHEKLQKGIEHRSFVFTSAVPNKDILARWKVASESSEPVLACMTSSFLSLPRSDLGFIILERESARSHRGLTRPFLHAVDIVTALGKHTQATVLLADEVLSVVTRARVSSGVYDAYEELRPRIRGTDHIRILDIRRDKDAPKKAFRPIHDSLASEIAQTLNSGSPVFLFGTRKGYANSVVCNDCGERVSCDVCEGPMSLETSARGRMLICRRCTASRSAKEKCKACDSWNLIELGIGSERIEEHAASLFGKNRVFRLDSDTAPDHIKARALYMKWIDTPGSILVGTERALPFLHARTSLSGVVALDSLLALPEWQAYERTFSILAQLATLSEKLVIQTRRPDEPVLKHISNGAIKEFMDEELSLRKQFSYPPFVSLIQVSVTGSEGRVALEQKKLEKLLKPWNPRLSVRKLPKGKSIGALLIAIENDSSLQTNFPEELLSILRSLPPFVSVVMNPDSTRA